MEEENATSSENLMTVEISELGNESPQREHLPKPMEKFLGGKYKFNTNQNSSMFKSGRGSL